MLLLFVLEYANQICLVSHFDMGTDGTYSMTCIPCRPICRTVSDAVHVLEAIVGIDPLDVEATVSASVYIPEGGYKQFLKNDGLRGKRLGILRKGFFNFPKGSFKEKIFEEHFNNML